MKKAKLIEDSFWKNNKGRKKARIVLVTPPSEISAGEEISNMYPLGLGYLGTIVEKAGHDVDVLDYSNKDWVNVEKEIGDIIKRKKPEIVGISCMVTNRTASFKLAKLIKSINPSIKVIMGGVHPTIMYRQVIEHFPIDFVVISEGELTFLELIDAIKKKYNFEKLKKIKGIVFKCNGEIIVTEPRPKMTNEQLDKLPIMKHEYFKDKIEKFKVAYIITSRGCPFNCSFCSSSQYWGRVRRQRSAENVLEEIKYVKEKFPKLERIYFADDEFICDKNRTIELCKMIINEKINVNWGFQGRITSIDEEIVDWLKKAGCSLVYLGIETGSQKLLNAVNKQVTVEQMERAINIIKKQGIQIIIYLIIGLPGESRKTVNETINFLKNVKLCGEPAILQIYPGTEICSFAIKNRFITKDYWLSDKLVPLYTYEHSKLKLLFWSFKISYFSKMHSEGFWAANKLLFEKIKIRTNPLKLAKFSKRYLLKR